jgi:glycerol-3-phosphate dehydrogenase
MWVLGMPDNRSIFAIPRGPIVYVGTTDTAYPRGAELEPEIASEDVEYLLAALPRHFAVEPVKPEDCVAAWAGLRPLIAEPGKKPSEISRRDEILVGPAGVVTIAGGKLTGYRPMTRRAVEQVASAIGARLAPAPPDDEPLPGGDVERDLDAAARELAREHRLGDTAALRLIRLYGGEAGALLRYGAEPLVAGGDARAGEVEWAVRVDGARGVEDVLYRRTRIALYEARGREAAAEAIGARMAALLDWDAARAADEVARAKRKLAADLAFARPVA